jgi:voltage-gated potassium channel
MVAGGTAMLSQLALASIMVIITVLVHLVGLNMVMRLLRSHSRFIRKLRITPLTLLLSASLGIFAIHTLEIWLYAALFLGLGAFSDFETALYFSTSTYAAIGYGDLLMPYGWRVLGAIEGATGIIMFGWSTAFFVSLLAKLNLLRHDWLAPDEVPPNSDRREGAAPGHE